MAGALQAARIQSMIRKGILTDEEGHEIYEQALLMLEASQAVSSSPDVFKAARELIEPHLRGPESGTVAERRSNRKHPQQGRE
jgi:hypothetical protein